MTTKRISGLRGVQVTWPASMLESAIHQWQHTGTPALLGINLMDNSKRKFHLQNTQRYPLTIR